ncbi:hypothetical protein HC248_02977 [Polaromonas vacuolata]|uniref:Uncharacterized protein n=1 Tax=Polaromonas vacuolata TaxID=37448 RepID=A0A6H2HD10_9BURK|nr:hypothetical protein HC248_02977 [Polaromonas vacuolata]
MEFFNALEVRGFDRVFERQMFIFDLENIQLSLSCTALQNKVCSAAIWSSKSEVSSILGTLPRSNLPLINVSRKPSKGIRPEPHSRTTS